MPSNNPSNALQLRVESNPYLSAAESLMALVPLGLTAWLAGFVAPISSGRTLSYVWNWVPSLNVALSFEIDGLSLVFALLISGIGTLIFAYAPGYFGNLPERGRLYAWLGLFMAAMLGLVLASNIITLFVFWELTSITSYMLIGFKHESDKARAAALQALLVTGLGGLALLAGLLILGSIGGSYELPVLLENREALQAHPLIVPAIILILLGAFTKSAQFPFHFWLPGAMEAPTPVSAYLHSATMVKAGVYLVARLSPALSGIPVWDMTITIVGALTAVMGGALALGQTDLKRILAYSTVSALGMLMLLLALGTPLAIKGAIVFLICHAFYKAALFLVAGTVDHCAGTREVGELGGLVRPLPLLAVAAALAALASAGVPPLGGFLAKEVIYDAVFNLPRWSLWITGAAILTNASFVIVAMLVAFRPFFASNAAAEAAMRHVKGHLPSWRLTTPPLLLGILGLVIGIAPGIFGSYFAAPAVVAIAGEDVPVKLKLWHGFNVPLLLSVITLAAGAAVYALLSRVLAIGAPLSMLAKFGPSAGYRMCLSLLKASASWQTSVLQNGRLRVYLLVVLTAFVGLIGFELVGHVDFPSSGTLLDLRLYELIVPALILCAAVMAISSSSRLAAVCALGVVGYAMALLFVMYGAPDLAMTQLAIETLTVILFVFVIYRLPRFTSFSKAAIRLRDGLVAMLGGAVMTAVVIAATFAHAPSRLAPFFVDSSLTEAKGRNMVNVILVDFRGIDTLGEVVVIAVAALGIYALMRLRLSSDKHVDEVNIHDSMDGAITTSDLDSLASKPADVAPAEVAAEVGS